MNRPSLRSFIAYRLGAARWVYSVKDRKLKQILAKRTNERNKYLADCIIAVNDEAYQNGGLCDCLHGIVSAYYVAKKQNRQFRICFTHPFHLSDYLLPNLTDWRIESEDIDYQSSRVRNVPMMLGRFHATWAEERAFHLRYLTQIAEQSGSTLLYTNAHLVGEREFSALFTELFRPSVALQQQIDYHLTQIGGPYIGASFRFRNLLGDVSEPDSSPTTRQEQEALIRRSIAQIESLHTENPNFRIFVASDSSNFCASLQSLPYVYCVQGHRGHISYQGTESVMSAFIDLFILSKSEGNTLFISDQLYRSGFAMTASFIGNISYQERHY